MAGHAADRTAFLAALDSELIRDHRSVAVIRLDLDRFSRIREVFGAGVSRAVRSVLLARLESYVAPLGRVLTYGEDAFIATMRVSEATPEALEVLGAGLVRSISQPIDLAGQPSIAVGSNVGVAAGADFGEPDALRLLAGAELAIQQANAIGSRRVIVYTVTDSGDPTRLPRLYADMLGAIHREEFVPYFQPVVSLPGKELAGVEALIRWVHPDHGTIPPAEFIPEAERSGLVRDIDAITWRQACETVAGLDVPLSVTLSVNLSAADLDFPELAATIDGCLAAAGLPADRLIVEVTETALSQDWNRSRRRLEAVRALGVRVAVDDFGAGHMYLDRLGTGLFDILKIDRSLVVPTESGSGRSVALLEGVVSLAHSLGMTVTAEGVETEDQETRILAAGCDRAQGYYYGYPMSAADLAARVATGS